MEMNFDPKEKKREEKQIRRKRWYRTLCGMAAVVVMCTVYTLMLPALTLDNDTNNGSDPAGSASVENVSDSSSAASETGSSDSASSNDSSDSADSNTNGNNNESDSNDSSADSSDSSTDPSDADGSAASTDKDSSAADNNTNDLAQPSGSASDSDSDTVPFEDSNSGGGQITGSSDSDPDQITDEDSENGEDQESGDNDTEEDSDTDENKSDDTADVETEADWIATLHDAISADNWDEMAWGEKLLAVAETQLGYTESILNFRTDDAGNHKGYTRYGVWYGQPYGDWCAMFVSFCLNYAGIDTDAVPQDANCSNWVKELEKLKIYEDKDLYVPEPGDIVFFDQDDSGHANHVGIISEVKYGTKTVTRHVTKDGSAVEDSVMNALKYINELSGASDDASGDKQAAELETVEVEVEIAESIKVIEGNSSDRVQYVEYEVAEDKILGYVSLENAKNVFENNDEEKPEEQAEGSLKYTGEDYTVKIKYTEEAQIPEGTELYVEELEEGTDTYADYYSRAAEKLMENSTAEDEEDLDISFARFFDIKLIHNGEEIEPAAPVTVKISYSDRVEVAEDQKAAVIHFAKTEATVENDSSWTSHASAMAMPATLALDDESTDSAASDDSSLNNSTSEDIVEVPELIEPKEVKNSVFEFEQSSFSVTATVISGSAAKNESFEDGKQYIIYYQSGSTTVKAISHSSNSLSLVDLSPVPNDNTLYDDATYSEYILWTYEAGGYFYYLDSDNNKKYLDLSAQCTKHTIDYFVGKYEYYSWDYNMFIADEKPASGLTIRDGKISKTIKDTEYNQTTTAYVHISNNSTLNASNGSTAFKFAKIEEVTEIPPELNITQNLTHKKYVKANSDGTYDLTLTVTGAKGTATDEAKIDVIVVLDTSGSMKKGINGGSTRMAAAKTAISSMVEALEKKNVATRYSLVTFDGNRGKWHSYPNGGGYWDGNDTAWNDARIELTWGTSEQLINKKDNINFQENTGTNYQAGLIYANQLLNADTNLNAYKVVVFISDGNPSFSYGSVTGENAGMTNSNQDGTAYNQTAMKEAQNQVKLMKANYLFTVGVGDESEYNNLNKLTDESVVPTGMNAGLKTEEVNLEGSTAGKLTEALTDIVTNITQVKCKRVSITDPLSEYAEATDKAQLVISWKNASNGTLLDSSNNSSTDDENNITASLTFDDNKLNDDITSENNITVTATYDKDTKTIVLDFPDDYELNPAYEFTVTLQIQPTQAAVDKYIALGYNYDNTGDLNTDAPGIAEEKWTSSGKPGFYSNRMNGNNTGAFVSYEYTAGNDGIQTEYYDKPVIQVDVESFELPETGGEGTALIYLLGAAIMAVPATVAVTRRRRKKMN